MSRPPSRILDAWTCLDSIPHNSVMQEASVPRFTDEDKDEDGERKRNILVPQSRWREVGWEGCWEDKGSRLWRKGQSLCFALHSKVVLAWTRLCQLPRKPSLVLKTKGRGGEQQSSWKTQLSVRRSLLFTLFVKRPWEWAFAELGFGECYCRCHLWVYLCEWEKSWSA